MRLTCWLALLLCASAAAAQQTVRIGATLPLSGGEAPMGTRYKLGYELAFEEANAAGGLLVQGQRIRAELVLRDDASSPAVATAQVDKLIGEDDVDALLGTYSSHLVEAQVGVANFHKVPYVSAGASGTPLYQEHRRYLFGVLSPVDELARSLLAWAAAHQAAGHLRKPARVALLWENTAHGRDFRNGVRSAKEGFRIVLDQSVELGSKDFAAVAAQVKRAGADVLLVDVRAPEHAALLRDFGTAGLCVPVAALGGLGAEGGALWVSGSWWDPSVPNEASRHFVERFRAKNGRAPEWPEAVAYEAARALFTAIEKAGSVDHAKVQAALAALELDSLLPGGKLRFTVHGQSRAPFVLRQALPDGSAQLVFPPAAAASMGELARCRPEREPAGSASRRP